MSTSSECIDLRQKFPFHKIGYEDPSYSGSQDPWHKMIRCKHGSIGPNGGDELLASTENHWNPETLSYRKSKATAAIEKCEACRVVQDADDGVNAIFNAEDAKQVFQIMGALRR